MKGVNNMLTGKINWYDRFSKKGSIIGDNGIYYRIHEFTTLSHKVLFTGESVAFNLAINSIHPIVQEVTTL